MVPFSKLTQEFIKEYDIVSFDVFDTLLLRNVLHPTDIFKLVELEYHQKHSKKIDFYRIRIQAEEEARKQTKNEDILLKDIYHVVSQKLDPTTSKELLEIELEMESNFLIANPEMVRLFEWAKSLKKIVYLITDMYLPSDIISYLLNKNGIADYDGLFVSGEQKVTKASGTMYAYIRKQEQIEGKKWLHIGDNYHSDVHNAMINKIDGCHYRHVIDQHVNRHVKTIGDSIITAVQINSIDVLQKKEYWYRFGYETIAPIFVGLMIWLANQLRNKDNIYFLSRDGYLPYQLYGILRKSEPELPRAQYLLASRRAYIYPYLLQLPQYEAVDLLIAYNPGLNQRLFIEEILANIGLEPKGYTEQLQKFGLHSLKEHVHERNTSQIKEFLISIWGDIQAVLQREHHSLMEYLRSLQIEEQHMVNVFDIGWRGSTQAALQKLIDKPVFGYYFGIAEDPPPNIRSFTRGYAFDKGRPYTTRKFILENIMMFELIFSAPEGSLINFDYNKETHEVIPNIKNVEKNDELYEIIQAFQSGVIELFHRIIPYYEYIQATSVEFALSKYKEFIYSYNACDMLQFNRLSNVVGFGDSYDSKSYVSLHQIGDYLSNRKNIDKQARYNLWKDAILVMDEQGRYFNREEVKRLYRLRPGLPNIPFRKYFLLMKKAIKNPRRAVWKIYNKVKILYRRQ